MNFWKFIWRMTLLDWLLGSNNNRSCDCESHDYNPYDPLNDFYRQMNDNLYGRNDSDDTYDSTDSYFNNYYYNDDEDDY